MWRVRIYAAIAFTVVALVATVFAKERTQADDGEHADAMLPAPHVRRDDDVPVDARTVLTAQLTDEAMTIDRALATVTDKLSAADTQRAHRLAAAYRLLRISAPSSDRLATARRHAAARLLIDRDLAERRILADELFQLRDAAKRTAGEVSRAGELVMPGSLLRPVRGKIARHFGILQHERSKATLSRRGIDFDVELRTAVVSPAAGTVRYAGPIRGLDSGVILDHGTYFTVIAKLGDLAVPVGAPVSRGDKLGRAARHRVYLEVRVKLGAGGLPIDPEPVLEPQTQRERDPR